ncbi:MAG: NUDIX hydrolase [Acidimicrobiales bacterium]
MAEVRGGRAGGRVDGAGQWSPDILRAIVHAHLPADDREKASVATFLAELDRLGRPFDEHADRTHVTASAVIAGRRGTILHVHRRLGRWLQPGGHVDPGETPPSAALRESVEETGLSLDHPPGGPRLLQVDVHPAAGDHRHLDLCYLLLGPEDDPAPPPGESPDVRWFAWDEAVGMVDAGLATALSKARAGFEGPRTGHGTGHGHGQPGRGP